MGDSDETAVSTIPALIAAAHAAGKASTYAGLAKSLHERPTRAVLAGGSSSADALSLWIYHLEAQRRGLAPCLRADWPVDSHQEGFIAFVADLRWLAKEHPTHQTTYERWRGIFGPRADVRSSDWHGRTLWIFRSGRLGARGGYYFSRGLGLGRRHMQPLATMQSNEQRGNRRLIAALPAHRDAILRHALVHRDKGGRVTPTEVADRRCEILRLYLLADRDATLAASYWTLLHGTSMSRQSLSRHIEHVEAATRLQLRAH